MTRSAKHSRDALPFGQDAADGARDNSRDADSDAGLPDIVSMTGMMLDYLGKGGTLAELFGTPAYSLEALYAHGHRLYQHGRFEEAMQAFSLLLTYDQFDRRTCMGFAACLQMRQQPAEALKYYGMASVMDLADPLPIFHSAQCMLALKRVDDALAALELVEKLAPGHPTQSELAGRATALKLLLTQTPGRMSHTGAAHA